MASKRERYETTQIHFEHGVRVFCADGYLMIGSFCTITLISTIPFSFLLIVGEDVE